MQGKLSSLSLGTEKIMNFTGEPVLPFPPIRACKEDTSVKVLIVSVFVLLVLAVAVGVTFIPKRKSRYVYEPNYSPGGKTSEEIATEKWETA